VKNLTLTSRVVGLGTQVLGLGTQVLGLGLVPQVVVDTTAVILPTVTNPENNPCRQKVLLIATEI